MYNDVVTKSLLPKVHEIEVMVEEPPIEDVVDIEEIKVSSNRFPSATRVEARVLRRRSRRAIVEKVRTACLA